MSQLYVPARVPLIDPKTGIVTEQWERFFERIAQAVPASGAGTVNGPALSTDNAIARWDGITGTLLQNSGITIADGASGTLSGTNTGNQNLFETIAVSGQSNVVADSPTDTLTLAAGSNVTITTNATTDTITIAASSSGGTVTTTGSPTTGVLTKFSGATSITDADAAAVSAALDLLP